MSQEEVPGEFDLQNQTVSVGKGVKISFCHAVTGGSEKNHTASPI